MSSPEANMSVNRKRPEWYGPIGFVGLGEGPIIAGDTHPEGLPSVAVNLNPELPTEPQSEVE